MAFRSGEAGDSPAFHTLKALGGRTENLRRMATTLLRKPLETSGVSGYAIYGRSPKEILHAGEDGVHANEQPRSVGRGCCESNETVIL